MSYFTPSAPRILAHRGLARDVPENTLAAFEAAARCGVTHMETDAQVTRDGYAVLWHDADLCRWNGQDTQLAQLTLAQLRAQRVGEHEIRTVAETLRLLPQLRFNIDVKVPGAACAVADAVRTAGATDRVLLTSFDDRTATRLRRLMPDAAHGAAQLRVAKSLAAMTLRSPGLLARTLHGSAAVQLPRSAGGIDLVTPARLQAWHSCVREVHVWTVNDTAEQELLFRRGVDGIVTDYADVGINTLRRLLAQ